MYVKTHQFAVKKAGGRRVMGRMLDVNASLVLVLVLIIPTIGVSGFA